jgi:cobalt-zinc-cadmium efflux system protein
MHHHHSTPPAQGTIDRNLAVSAVINGGITVVEIAGSLASGSVALFSDAIHNLSDVAAVLLAIWTRRHARKPPTLRYTFGFKRAEVLAALVNAGTLIVIAALIGRHALSRLLRPVPVDPGVMLGVAVAALAANLASVMLLRRHDPQDLNVRSAFLHMAQDALASFAVVIAALLARTPAGPWVDPVAGLLIAALVFRSALALVWETVRTIMEAVPEDVDIELLASEVENAFPVARMHHIHVWRNGPDQRLLTGHVVLPEHLGAREIEELFGAMKEHLHARWRVAHATLEPEVLGCGESEILGSWPQPHVHLHSAPDE